MKIKQFPKEIYVHVEVERNDEDSQWFTAGLTRDEVYGSEDGPVRVALYRLVDVGEVTKAEPIWKAVSDTKAFAR